jgi:hypothetical protein
MGYPFAKSAACSPVCERTVCAQTLPVANYFQDCSVFYMVFFSTIRSQQSNSERGHIWWDADPANAAGGRDNITVVLVTYHGAPNTDSWGESDA